ncbi:MAG: hypothetical protein M1828_003857 [Chrysothrix sp. TS-e1954]|nr:MAG: hypothetical protein M1828_003857 [Chrysothrix sp. TS-e1954]
MATDLLELSSLSENLEEGRKFRNDMNAMISRSLGFGNNEQDMENLQVPPVIGCFSEIGNAIRQAYNDDQCRRLVNEICLFTNMSAVEQQAHLTERMPTVREYQDERLGYSGVGVGLALLEYCFAMKLPHAVLEGQDFQIIRKETNTSMSIVNDLLSLKKEVAQGQVRSLLPILYANIGNIQSAVDAAMVMLKHSIKKFEQAAHNLRIQAKGEAESYRNTELFIKGCMYACTANLQWSMSSGRYALGEKRPDGSLIVKL